MVRLVSGTQKASTVNLHLAHLLAFAFALAEPAAPPPTAAPPTTATAPPPTVTAPPVASAPADHGEDPVDPRVRVSLTEVFDLLKRKSPRYKAYQADIDVAKSEVTAARVLPNPLVNLAILYLNSGFNQNGVGTYYANVTLPLLVVVALAHEHARLVVRSDRRRIARSRRCRSCGGDRRCDERSSQLRAPAPASGHGPPVHRHLVARALAVELHGPHGARPRTLGRGERMLGLGAVLVQ